MKYKILEHKADLKIKAFGKSKEEIFSNFLLGINDFLKPTIKDQKKIKRKIIVKSLNLPSLLVDFINEVLYLNQVGKEVYFEAKFKEFSEKNIEAELIGKKVERFEEDIKAATYHEVAFKKKNNKTWEATLLFDI